MHADPDLLQSASWKVVVPSTKQQAACVVLNPQSMHEGEMSLSKGTMPEYSKQTNSIRVSIKMQPGSPPAFMKRPNTNTRPLDIYLRLSACWSHRLPSPVFQPPPRRPDPRTLPGLVTTDLAFVPTSLGARSRSGLGWCSRVVVGFEGDYELPRNHLWHHPLPYSTQRFWAGAR